MSKHLTLLLLLPLLFISCAERGYTPKPFSKTSMSRGHLIVKNKTNKITPVVTTKKETFKKVKHIIQKSKCSKPNINTSKINQTKVITKVDEIKRNKLNEDSFFTFSDETKNKISGFFVIIIGMIILL